MEYEGMQHATRSLSEPQKKMVAARQKWRCSECDELLSSAYQVDHTTPLWSGGEDALCNVTAMCANCHALKTQAEHVARVAAAHTSKACHEDRTDFTVAGGKVKCELCFKVRPAAFPHPICHVIDAPGMATDMLHTSLATYAFAPRWRRTTM
mgnify:CR=1 FL=1